MNIPVWAIQNDENFNKALNSFDKSLLKRHLRYLGSDIFEGRATGSIGASLSSKYIADRLDQIGLKPVGANGTFYQYIQMHGSIPLPESELSLTTPEKSYKLQLNREYYLFKSGEQTFIPNPLDLIFVGYGISAPEWDYNDYQSVDVEGKIVVFLSGEPESDDKNYFDGDLNTVYYYPESKLMQAMSRGAAGCIMIPRTQDYGSFTWNTLINSFNFEDVSLAYTVSSGLMVLMEPNTSAKIFEGSEYSLDEILKMSDEHKLKSFNLKSKLSFKGKFKERNFVSPNIVGLLEGSDPDLKDTYVIITAHYDHLGVGPAVRGDSIYNGVFDNAIGVAGVMELAEAFVKLGKPPKRSILFILTTGEEKGLLGSTYYTDNPIFPLYKTVANLNVDGLAYIDKFKTIIPIGAGMSSLDETVNKVAKKNNLSISTIPPEFLQQESFELSDQVAFAKAGVPSLLIYDGVDYEKVPKDEAIKELIHYSTDIYHTPFDDLNQNINYDATIQHLKIIFEVCFEIANSDTAPEWKKGSPYYNARLRSRAEKR